VRGAQGVPAEELDQLIDRFLVVLQTSYANCARQNLRLASSIMPIRRRGQKKTGPPRVRGGRGFLSLGLA